MNAEPVNPDPVRSFWDIFASFSFMLLILAFLVTLVIAIGTSYPLVALAGAAVLAFMVWRRRA